MPALDPVMVMAFVDELVAPGRRAELDERGGAELTYRPSGGDPVGVTIERTPQGFRLIVRRGARSTSPAPTPRPPSGNVLPTPSSGGPSTEYSISTPVHARTKTPSSAALPLPSAHEVGLTRATAQVADLIAQAAERRASDLILTTGFVPRLRIDGELVELDERTSTDDDLLGVVEGLAGAPAARGFGERGVVDFGASAMGQRVRGHAFRHERGIGLALRLVRADVPTVASLGLPEDLTSLVHHRSGLVLVAGPTGSGKSTTLVALIAHLNRTRTRHIVTLEDPIEYLHTPDRAMIHQREIGRHTPSFADGLRAALREAPDVIVVGELRDRETITIALTAAETGHLVLGTVHAPGAAGAIDRLIDAYPEHQQGQARAQLAATLRCVVTQYLVPTRLGGRAVAIERVPVTTAVAALIRKNELQMLGTHIQIGRDAGMVPLERSLATLVRTRAVDPAIARATALDLDYFDQAMRMS